ncbi:MAG: hypothetical protein NTX17_04655 [Candidatus Eisenbacteria bacterium]|nr:hypothetical protein [Candidatus Eisenbacteria bacterium]
MRKMGSVVLPLMVVCLMALWAPCGDGEAGRRGEGLGLWWAPDSACAVRLAQVVGLERIARLLEGRPEKVVGWLMLERMVEDEGEWFWIRVRMKNVKSVTFTKSTKIVVTERDGRRVESEGIFFWPDYHQTSLYDSREMCVVVGRSSVWQGLDGLAPTGCVKFAAGSVRVGDVRGFEVVGAIVDVGGGETR